MATGSERVKENLRHFLDVGSSLSRSLSKMSRQDLERMIREVVESAPGAPRERIEEARDRVGDAKERVGDALEELRARGLRTAEQVVTAVRDEVRREVGPGGRGRTELADIVERTGTLVSDLLGAVGRTHPDEAANAGEETPASATPPRATPATQAAAKRAPAGKQSAAKKAASAKKASPPKKAATVNKTATARRAASATKASPAKKAAAGKKSAPAGQGVAKRATGAKKAGAAERRSTGA